MSDIQLFQNKDGTLAKLDSSSAVLERWLQTLFEKNLDTLLGVRFLASEYPTTHGGRMDTLGIDENGYPVIIEYKRDHSESIINQGLFYLDWLMDHRGSFELLMLNCSDKEAAKQIEWSAPRLICIAADFTKYDTHAVKQMGRNIELIRYRQFDENLLLLELLTTVSTTPQPADPVTDVGIKTNKFKTVSDMLSAADTELANLYHDAESFMLGLGDDVTKKILLYYFAFRRIKNFACVEIRTKKKEVRIYLKIDPDSITLEPGFTHDLSAIGHLGTGDLEVVLKTHNDLERAKPLIRKSYQAP